VAGWAEWAEWITKSILFTLDFARKAPNSGAFFVSTDGSSIETLPDEKESRKINKLEQVPKHSVNFSATRTGGANSVQALFLQSLAAPVSPGS
jgi:hypothetical protein